MSSRAWMDPRTFVGFPWLSLAEWWRFRRPPRLPVGEGSPDAAALRDAGLRTEFLDYRADTNLGSGSKRRQHGAAERAALGWPLILNQRH